MQSMAWREDKFLFGLLLFDVLLVSETKMIFIKLFRKRRIFLKNRNTSKYANFYLADF